jgi:Tol biopolymer transport system component
MRQLDSPSSTRLIDNNSASIVGLSPAGQPYLLFARAHTLMAQSFELASGRMIGEPFSILPNVFLDPLRNFGYFSASLTGTLVYEPPGDSGSRRPVYLDRQGWQHGEAAPSDHDIHISVSPNGRKVIVQRAAINDYAGTFILDLSSHTAKRFDLAGFPIWSADGKRILGLSRRDGLFGLVQKAVNGSDESELLAPSKEPVFPLDWSPDGRFVLYQQNNPKTRSDVFLLELANGKDPIPFLNSAHNESHAQFSPNGKWVAYTSDESGSRQVYAEAFRGLTPASGPRWQVSQNGGGKPKWRRDGRELFFIAPDGRLMAAAVSGASPIFQADSPAPLFSTTLSLFEVSQQYSPAPDGKGFFMLQRVAEPARPLIVVSNWSKLKP